MKISRLIISLGSNTADGADTVARAVRMLRTVFRSVTATRTLQNAAVGMGAEAPDFHNALVLVRTTLSEDDARAVCKAMESCLANTLPLRRQGVIVLDADIVMADGHVRRHKDYEREYFRTLLRELPEE